MKIHPNFKIERAANDEEWIALGKCHDNTWAYLASAKSLDKLIVKLTQKISHYDSYIEFYGLSQMETSNLIKNRKKTLWKMITSWIQK